MSSNTKKELWQGNFLANRHGYWGYGFLAVGFFAMAVWFGYPALIERYPGRWALGDDLYASWPMSRSVCFLIAAVAGGCGAFSFYRGRKLHLRYAGYWRDERARLATRWPTMHLVEVFKVKKQIESLRSDADNTFHRLAARVESAVRQNVAHTTVDPNQKDGLPPNSSMALIDGQFFRSNVPGVLHFRWQRHEKVDKWKCIEILVEGIPSSHGISLSVKCSVALHDITDPTEYPREANPIDVYGTGKKFTSESTTKQSMKTYSAQVTTSSQGTSVTYTDHFVDYSRQPASEHFKFWFEQHPVEFFVYERAREAVIDAIYTFDREVDGNPLGGLSSNV